VIVLDENAGGEIDAVIGASAAEDGVFLENAHARNGLTGIEDACVRTFNGIDVFAGEGGDAAEMLEQVENHALGTEQDARVVADDGKDLAGMGADAVEHFAVVDNVEAIVGLWTGIEAGKNLEEARHGAKATDDHFFACNDGGGGAQLRIDGEAGRGILDRLVFNKGLFEECVDAVALPIHVFSLENSF
jgi:hypothetical protein